MGGQAKMAPSVEAMAAEKAVAQKLSTEKAPVQGNKKKKGKAAEANVEQKDTEEEVSPVSQKLEEKENQEVSNGTGKQAPETPSVAPAAAAPVVRAPAPPAAKPEGPCLKKFHAIVAHFGLLMWSTSAVFAFLVLGMCLVIVWLPYAAYRFFVWYTTPIPPFGAMRPVAKPQKGGALDWAFTHLWATGAMLEKTVDKLYEAPLQKQLAVTLVSTVVNYMILCWYVRDNQPTRAQFLVPEAVQLSFDFYMPF